MRINMKEISRKNYWEWEFWGRDFKDFIKERNKRKVIKRFKKFKIIRRWFIRNLKEEKVCKRRIKDKELWEKGCSIKEGY